MAAVASAVPGSALPAVVRAGGVGFGLERPIVLLSFPVAVLLLGWLVLRRRGVRGRREAGDRDEAGAGDGDSDGARAARRAGRRTRLALFGSRTVVVALLVVAAAGPYTVASQQTPGDPRVTMLVDESASMDLYDADVDALASAISAQGVPVSTVTVGSRNESPVGDGVVANLQAGGSVLVVSDGRVTGGRSLDAAAELARATNASISAVNLSTDATERGVELFGPARTSVGVENRFLVRVEGTNVDGNAPVTVLVDGEEVVSEAPGPDGAIEFAHTFEATGTHRLVAVVDGSDVLAANDLFRKTVRVVEQPRLLYVSDGEYPFAGLLDELYDVERAQSVPADLDPYLAVVLQNLPAGQVGNVDELQRFVIDGNGLVVVGGDRAFEAGDYGSSPLAGMLPVSVGDAAGGGRDAPIVIAVDVSGSAEEGMRTQKALALDVLDQLPEDATVGLVAFNQLPYRLVEPAPLAESRATIEDRIRRLTAGGGTRIGFGLLGASDVLGGSGGNVILVSDGLDDTGDVVPIARQLGEDGTRVVTVGVGSEVDAGLLQRVAEATGGTYLRADQTSRLQLLFGDREAAPGGAPGLAVVDGSHFVTTGVTLTANPPEANDVAVRTGADYLVATGDGTPAVAAWRYGLGRVVTVTAYGDDGTLDGLLASPDSLLLSKATNWAIGDPERKTAGVVTVPDARVGGAVTASYVGETRPEAPDVRFRRVAADRYEATVVPADAGFRSLLDAEYAVNYPREYDAFGLAPALEAAVGATGGRLFEPGEAAAIAEFVTRRAIGVREVRTGWTWAFLVAALLGYLAEVAARRLQIYARGEPTV